MTERLFRDDPYPLEFEARVVGCREHEGRPAVVLDRTAFYAESGGQPWDLGELGGAAVLAVVEAPEGTILHVLDRPLAEGHTVRGRVDAARRRDHREQHHGQHLLSRAFVEVAQAPTTSFHLGAEASTIDLERALEGEARRLLARLEDASRPALVVATYDGWPAADLRVLAQKLVALAPCVALLGSRADKAHLVFAQSPGLGHDVPALLRAAVATLGGRGGGKGDLAQGGGDRADLLEDALAAAARAVRGDASAA